MKHNGVEETFVKVCEGLYSGMERGFWQMEQSQDGLVLRGVLGKVTFISIFV